ncbi:hypothetical protein G6F65_021536 [Rhizopus arrhizus]|nr:hypothetical protein G6F65_021536 [Rhizopus arrhizus]
MPRGALGVLEGQRHMSLRKVIPRRRINARDGGARRAEIDGQRWPRRWLHWLRAPGQGRARSQQAKGAERFHGCTSL